MNRSTDGTASEIPMTHRLHTVAQLLTLAILRLRERLHTAAAAGETVGLAMAAQQSVHVPPYPSPEEPVCQAPLSPSIRRPFRSP